MLNKKTLAIIVGTGRSGTNMMGRVLAKSPYTEAALEEEPIFSLVLRACRHPDETKKLWPKIRDAYKRRAIDSKKQCFVDKTHTMLWFMDEARRDLGDMFNLCFVMMRRDVLPVVSSMLKHSSVRGHCENPAQFSHPNFFLGTVTEDLHRKYTSFSIEQRCALRWLSHKSKIDLEAKNDDSMCIDYDTFVRRPNKYMVTLSSKLGVAIPAPRNVHARSLNKWRDHLTGSQVNSIKKFVRTYRSEVKKAVK